MMNTKSFGEVDAARFLSLVDRSDPDGCWEWKGTLFQKGYGRFYVASGSVRAHRVSYELFIGPIPDGLIVCHHCDNPRCVRPDHFFIGTSADNHADRNRKGRQAKGERSGVRLHPEVVRRGEESPNAKLTAGKVREMRRRFEAGGVTQQQLANEYGIIQPHVSRILLRQSWSHIE